MSAPSNKLGVAVVGLGVGEQHARAYAITGHCRLRTLCDLDLARARKLAAELGAETVADNYEPVLLDPEVDLVSIASFDDAHYAQTLAALEAGKHVFVEKPLCRTLAELRSLKAAWARYGGRVHLASNLILRAAPLYRWLREQIVTGTVGELYAIDGDYLYGRLHKITAGWRRDVRDYSVMLGGGVHLVDLMLWLSGARPATAYAAGNRISTRETLFRYDDFVAATFRFESGMVGRVTANFGCVHRHQHVLRLFGTRASFLYDDAGARWHASRDPDQPPEFIALAPLASNKGDLIPGFVADILAERDVTADTQLLFDAISVCAAADESVRENKEVEACYI